MARHFSIFTLPFVPIVAILAAFFITTTIQAAPFLADGAKTGEVTATTAILWTRLTLHPDANWDGAKFTTLDLAELRKHPATSQLPDGATLADMHGALPGCAGKAKLTFWPADHPQDITATDWSSAKADADFTLNFPLKNLRPGTRYEFMIEAKSDDAEQPSAVFNGKFSTAPISDAEAAISFVAAAGFDWNARDDADDQGHLIYESMANLEPDFFVHAGDIVNYEAPGPIANTLALARHKWNRMWVLKNSRDFYRRIPCYMINDQHGSWIQKHPASKEKQSTVNLAQQVFREQVPFSDLPYRTFRWGQHLQIWLLASIATPDALANDPATPLWGTEQLDWVEKSIADSAATFKIFLAPSLLVKHWQRPPTEATAEIRRIRAMFKGETNLFVVSANRQWQSHTTDPQTGLRIYGIGPGSDATDANQGDPPSEADAGGFLQVTIDPQDAPLAIHFNYYDVDGNEVKTSSHPTQP